MNNTFSLGIFLLLMFVQKLAWKFSAETISILVIEVRTLGLCFISLSHYQVLVFVYMNKKNHRVFDGIVVIMFYPLCILLVAMLEGYAGID
jgi:hypothetical protein